MSLPLQSDFVTCHWDDIEETKHPGARGAAFWCTQQYGEVRVRRVRYSADYVADHWCERGHVLYVLDGTLSTELQDGREIVLTAGMSYAVRDGGMAHRSRTEAGALLFIVD